VPGERPAEVRRRTAAVLLGLQSMMQARHEQPSQNWPLRIGDLFDQLCARDSRLAAAVVDRPDFGRPEHGLFASRMKAAERTRAARKLLELSGRGDARSTSELVQLIAELPAKESLPYLREQWEDFALRDSVVSVLAGEPREEDREKFIEGLTSPQPAVVERCARALAKLPAAAQPAGIAATLTALGQACSPAPAQAAPRKALVELLTRWSGQTIAVEEKGVKDLRAAYAPWFQWFAKAYPREAAALHGFVGNDAGAWNKRLAQVRWSGGDGVRGRQVFERRACHRCHEVSGHLGPQLTGAVSRMSREDLFAAIIDPNKEVAPAYQTTVITTHTGQVYHGLIVYESPEGTLLQTGPDTTVRIAGDQRAEMRPSRQSLMPTGLLNSVTDEELADLYAYLKTLAAK
jgi:putative heme-binding domain-containing protein